MNAPNAFGKNRRDREHLDTGNALLFGERDRIGDDQLFDAGLLQPLNGRAGENAVRCAGVNLTRASRAQRFGAVHQRAGSIHNVIREKGAFAFYISDDVDDFTLVRLGAPLGDDRQVCPQAVGEHGRPADSPDVRRNDHGIAVRETSPMKILGEERAGGQMVDGQIEEALDRLHVHVNEEDAVSAGGGDEIGEQPGNDGLARLGLFFLARVSRSRG